MATTRLMPLHSGKGRRAGQAIRNTLEYVMNPGKTERGELIASYACDHHTVDMEFMLSKREYINRTGRIRGADDVIAYHLRQSFVPGEITPQEANRLGQELARRFTHGEHAFIVATHTDKQHIHNHIIFHSVNLDCDRKFKNFWDSSKALRKLNDTICIENGYSIVEQPKAHGKSYNKCFLSRVSEFTLFSRFVQPNKESNLLKYCRNPKEVLIYEEVSFDSSDLTFWLLICTS